MAASKKRSLIWTFAPSNHFFFHEPHTFEKGTKPKFMRFTGRSAKWRQSSKLNGVQATSSSHSVAGHDTRFKNQDATRFAIGQFQLFVVDGIWLVLQFYCKLFATTFRYSFFIFWLCNMQSMSTSIAASTATTTTMAVTFIGYKTKCCCSAARQIAYNKWTDRQDTHHHVRGIWYCRKEKTTWHTWRIRDVCESCKWSLTKAFKV